MMLILKIYIYLEIKYKLNRVEEGVSWESILKVITLLWDFVLD